MVTTKQGGGSLTTGEMSISSSIERDKQNRRYGLTVMVDGLGAGKRGRGVVREVTPVRRLAQGPAYRKGSANTI